MPVADEVRRGLPGPAGIGEFGHDAAGRNVSLEHPAAVLDPDGGLVWLRYAVGPE